MDDMQLKALINTDSQELRKGDRVELLHGGNNFPLHGYYNGGIYTVSEPNHTHTRVGLCVEINKDGYGGGYARRDQLRKVHTHE